MDKPGINQEILLAAILRTLKKNQDEVAEILKMRKERVGDIEKWLKTESLESVEGIIDDYHLKQVVENGLLNRFKEEELEKDGERHVEPVDLIRAATLTADAILQHYRDDYSQKLPTSPVPSSLTVPDQVASELRQQNQNDILEIVRKLETFIVVIGNQQLAAATILKKIWGELVFGKIDYEIAGIIGKEFGVANTGTELFRSSNSVLQQLSLYRIVQPVQRLMPNGPRPSYHQTHWILTDSGKEIVQFWENANRKH